MFGENLQHTLHKSGTVCSRKCQEAPPLTAPEDCLEHCPKPEPKWINTKKIWAALWLQYHGLSVGVTFGLNLHHLFLKKKLNKSSLYFLEARMCEYDEEDEVAEAHGPVWLPPALGENPLFFRFPKFTVPRTARLYHAAREVPPVSPSEVMCTRYCGSSIREVPGAGEGPRQIRSFVASREYILEPRNAH